MSHHPLVTGYVWFPANISAEWRSRGSTGGITRLSGGAFRDDDIVTKGPGYDNEPFTFMVP
jgi:hypothetical protein